LHRSPDTYDDYRDWLNKWVKVHGSKRASPDYSSGRIRARSCVEPPLARARSSGNGLDE
jgi:hypothetical protein